MNGAHLPAATCDAGQHLEAIFSSVSEGILALDSALTITRANPAARRVLGRDDRSLVGESLARVLPAPLAGRGRPAAEILAQGESISCERTVVVAHGVERLSVVVTASPLSDSSGRGAGWVVVLCDVTELEELRDEARGRHQFGNLIGKSRAMQDLFHLAGLAARSDASVVLEGESGTGKELVARAIHYGGARASGPFVAVHCAALAESLLESELFGHVKGAFTGATADRNGRFELASGGTLFLDELGEIPRSVQVKLLRAVQERSVERVGSADPVPIDVRIVAATNRDLPEQVKRGEFREDLYYRLRVVAIPLPPLRERKEDIPLLVEHFLERFRERTKKAITRCDESVHRAFLSYDWPGNVRELENAIERAFVVSPGPSITLADLPPEVLRGSLVDSAAGARGAADERDRISAALRDAGWNKALAARRLGMGRNTLYSKMELHEIPKEPPLSRS